MSIHDAGSATSRAARICRSCCRQSRPGKHAWPKTLTPGGSCSTAISARSTISRPWPLDGDRTALRATLGALARRFHNLPLAGVLLFTDGNSTDVGDVPWDELPPIYPVVIGQDDVAPDISVPRVSVSQTNFESAPVVVRADIDASGFCGQPIVAQLFDENGEELQSQTVERGENG